MIAQSAIVSHKNVAQRNQNVAFPFAKISQKFANGNLVHDWKKKEISLQLQGSINIRKQTV